jgi:hypothetical protein
VNIEHPTSNIEPETNAPRPTEPLSLCPHCNCREFFTRKDFPQKLGLALVAIAAIAFLILAARPATFYLGVIVLLTVTALDALLYLFVPKITTCYKCRADFRGRPISPELEPFDLATAEKYRPPT